MLAMEDRQPEACADPPPPPEVRSGGGLQWTSLADAPIHLFSAYIDNRLPGYPYVRIIAAVRGPAPPPPLFCHLRARGAGAVVLAAAALPIWAEGWAADDVAAPTALRPHLLSCGLPPEAEGAWPEAVAVAASACAPPPAPIPALPLAAPPADRAGTFAVCVKALDFPESEDLVKEVSEDSEDTPTTVSPQEDSIEEATSNGNGRVSSADPDATAAIRLVEWLELHLLFGANHFFVYLSTAGRRVREVLQVYQRRGVLTGITLPPSPGGDTADVKKLGAWERRRRELLQYNDCLYRNAGAFEFIVPLDVDEVLLPVAGESWSSALEALERLQPGAGARAASLSARHAFFPSTAPALPPSAARPAYLHTLTHVRRAPFRPRVDAAAHAKSFVRASPASLTSSFVPAGYPSTTVVHGVVQSRATTGDPVVEAEPVHPGFPSANALDSDEASATVSQLLPHGHKTRETDKRDSRSDVERGMHMHEGARRLRNGELAQDVPSSVAPLRTSAGRGTRPLEIGFGNASGDSPRGSGSKPAPAASGAGPGAGTGAGQGESVWGEAGMEEVLGACALTVHNHWALRAVAPGATRLLPLPPRVAQLNHYRFECGRPPLWSEEACADGGAWVVDDSLARRFGGQLRERAEPVLRALRLIT